MSPNLNRIHLLPAYLCAVTSQSIKHYTFGYYSIGNFGKSFTLKTGIRIMLLEYHSRTLDKVRPSPSSTDIKNLYDLWLIKWSIQNVHTMRDVPESYSKICYNVLGWYQIGRVFSWVRYIIIRIINSKITKLWCGLLWNPFHLHTIYIGKCCKTFTW